MEFVYKTHRKPAVVLTKEEKKAQMEARTQRQLYREYDHDMRDKSMYKTAGPSECLPEDLERAKEGWSIVNKPIPTSEKELDYDDYDAVLNVAYHSSWTHEQTLAKIKEQEQVKNKKFPKLEKIVKNFFLSRAVGVSCSWGTIHGPIYVGELYNPDTKTHVYIVGEEHSMSHTCEGSIAGETILDFYNNLFTNAPCLVDFYLELPFGLTDPKERIRTHTQGFPELPNVRAIPDVLKKCQTNPECVVRAHLIDVRPIENDEYNTIFTSTIPNETFLSITTRFGLNRYDIANLKQLILRESPTYFINYMLNRPLVRKELCRSYYYKNIIKELKTEVSRRLEKFLTPEIRREILAYLSNPLSDIHGMSEQSVNSMIILETHIQDLYTLARILKVFNPTEPHSNEPTQRVPRNIVLHVGHTHAVSVENVLKRLGFIHIGMTEPLNEGIVSINCVNFYIEKDKDKRVIRGLGSNWFSNNVLLHQTPRSGFQKGIDLSWAERIPTPQPSSELLLDEMELELLAFCTNPQGSKTPLNIVELTQFEQTADQNLSKIDQDLLQYTYDEGGDSHEPIKWGDGQPVTEAPWTQEDFDILMGEEAPWTQEDFDILMGEE